jgi:hypothetical protein
LAKIPAGTEACVSIASLHIVVFRVDGYERIAGISYCLSFVWKVYEVGKYQVMPRGGGKAGHGECECLDGGNEQSAHHLLSV